MYNQVDRHKINLDFLHDAGVRFIHLVRENLLKKNVSSEFLRLSKTAHTTGKVDQKIMKIDINDMLTKLKNMNDDINRYQNLMADKNCFHLSYESFFQSQGDYGKQILEFLNVPVQSTMACELKKMTTDDLNSVILNWEEVVEALVNANYTDFVRL